MKNIMTTIVSISIGLTVLFILLNSVVMSNYNTVGGGNWLGTGMTATTFQGLLLLVFVLAIIGIAMSFFGKQN